MKKKLLITSILILAVIFFSCSEKSSDDEKNENNGITQTKINYKNGNEYTLQYGLTEGLTYNYKVFTNTETTRSNGKESQTMTVNVDYTLELNPIDVDPDGEMDLKVKFQNIKMEAEFKLSHQVGVQRYSYDSENPADSSKANSPQLAEYAIFKDAMFSARITPTGEIIEIYKLDNLINKILAENINTVGDEVKAQLKTKVEMQVSSMVSQLFQFLPSTPIQLDSVWSKETSERLDEETISKNSLTYKILDVKNINGKDIAFINAKLMSNIPRRKTIEEPGVKYEFKKPLLSGQGEIQFNLENGLVVSRNLETNMSGGAKISQGYNIADITDKTKTVVRVELVKIK
jgi:hypothetical protein